MDYHSWLLEEIHTKGVDNIIYQLWLQNKGAFQNNGGITFVLHPLHPLTANSILPSFEKWIPTPGNLKSLFPSILNSLVKSSLTWRGCCIIRDHVDNKKHISGRLNVEIKELKGPVLQSDVCLTFKSKDESNLILHVAACQSRASIGALKVHLKSKGNGNWTVPPTSLPCRSVDTAAFRMN